MTLQVLVLLLLAGCGGAAAELATADMAHPATPPQIAQRAQDAAVPLRELDLRDSADAAQPVLGDASETPDLSLSLDQAGPADMAPPCGAQAQAQACCPGYLCTVGSCMRSAMGYPSGSGVFKERCVQGGNICGSYLQSACVFTADGVQDAWCSRDAYAATDGNTSGWLSGSPCRPQ